MTERASDLLSEIADRLSANPRDSGQVVAESVVTLEPERLRPQQDGASIDELLRTPAGFPEIRGRSLGVAEIAEVGLRETLKVLRLQAGAVWTREGARLMLAKTLGLQPGEEEEFESGRSGARVRVVEIASGAAESRVDRITGEWSAIRAELRTKGVLLGAMTVATRLPRTF